MAYCKLSSMLIPSITLELLKIRRDLILLSISAFTNCVKDFVLVVKDWKLVILLFVEFRMKHFYLRTYKCKLKIKKLLYKFLKTNL